MIRLHQGESISTWMGSIEMPTFPSLTRDLKTEVCIVGGGITGLTTAYLLQQEGLKVCVLEAFEIGSGQSLRSTAHVTYALDESYQRLEKIHGTKGIKLLAKSHTAAIKKIREIIEEEKIECDLERVNGYLFSSGKSPSISTDPSFFRLELEALARAELDDVYLTERIPLRTYDPGPALCFPDQLQLNPLKYMKRLAEIIVARGGEIYTNSHVCKVHGGEEASVKIDSNLTISCDAVVVATNSPINDLLTVHTKQTPHRTYAVGFEVPKGLLINALYWDLEKPYHFVRLEKNCRTDCEILIIGGEDHRTGQDTSPEDCYTRLENWARQRFPQAGRVLYRWSGQVMEPIDRISFIGKNPMDYDNVYIATGFSGNGLTYSMIAGLLLTDLILQRENPWEGLYHPSRISLYTAATFIKENANTLSQYRDWLSEKADESFDQLSLGEGVVYRDGLHLVAAFKDEHGHLTLNSAVCPHLGGIVRWNAVEKSWDCPCHGSRFDCYGQVIDGPAISNLSAYHDGALHPPDLLKINTNPSV